MHFIEWCRLLSLFHFKDICIHMLVILMGVILKRFGVILSGVIFILSTIKVLLWYKTYRKLWLEKQTDFLLCEAFLASRKAKLITCQIWYSSCAYFSKSYFLSFC
jgi:hypothetical protein